MDFTPKTLPTNLEAEQAVLAAVLMNNRALERVDEFLNYKHFSHPAHQEIYKLAEKQFAPVSRSILSPLKTIWTNRVFWNPLAVWII